MVHTQRLVSAFNLSSGGGRADHRAGPSGPGAACDSVGRAAWMKGFPWTFAKGWCLSGPLQAA